MSVQFPNALSLGSTIAITAFSDGVREGAQPRLDLVIRNLKEKGFKVIEGQCLRGSEFSVSANKEARLSELMGFLLDDSIDAIFPPWGGEYAMELLPLIDYAALARCRPKWIVGFSDVSTLAVALTQKLNWATVHCSNLMDLHKGQKDPLTAQTLDHLALPKGSCFEQQSSTNFQRDYISFEENTAAVLNLTEPTYWRTLQGDETLSLKGRLVGGCLDILFQLVGTDYFDPSALKARWNEEPIVLYFENCEMSVGDLKRALISMKIRGAFDGIAGLVFGRNAGGDVYDGLTHDAMLQQVFGDAEFPIIMDADIGHLPPNLCLINGASAEIQLNHGKASIKQWL